jgi:hypothetical protein
MKIYDIITESQHLSESLIIFGQMLKYVVSKGGAGLDHALAYVSKKYISKPDDLAAAWILVAEKLSMSADEAIALGLAAAKKAGVADDVVTAATSKAEAIAKKKLGSIWGQLKTPQSQLNFYYGAGFSRLNAGLTFFGIAKPVYDCAQKILYAYQLRDEGNEELQDINKLSWVVQYYIDECVQQVVTTLLGNKILKTVVGKWVPGVAYNVPILGKLFQMLDPVYSKLTPAAQAYFKYWMLTGEGQEAVSKWIVGQAIVPGTDWKIPLGPTYQEYILNPASGIAKTGYDHILRQMGSDKAAPLPKPAGSTGKETTIWQNYDMDGKKLDKPIPLN